MRLLGALCVAAVGTIVVADECCVPLNIIHATITSDGTRSTSKLVANKTTRADVEEIIAESIADSWEARRLATDKTCVANREAVFGAGAPAPKLMPGTAHWVIRGEELVESDFARFLYDLNLVENVWGGQAYDKYERVVVVKYDTPNLTDGLIGTTTSNADKCSSDANFTVVDIGNSMKAQKAKLVIIEKSMLGGSALVNILLSKGVETSPVVNTGDLEADITKAMEYFGSQYTDCIDCLTTTTKAPTEATKATTTTTITTTTTMTATTTTTTPEPTLVTQAPTTSAAHGRMGAIVSVCPVAILMASWFILGA